MKKKPCYLKAFWIYFFCIVTPPIGYLIVFLNLKRLEDTNEEGHSEKIYYLVIATISMAFWMLKFLPNSLRLYVSVGILSVLIGRYLLKKLNKG
ncbi:hypothetical protein QNH32_05200 [Priestia flexa]|uniref:hypothetical protein n=1 Tax=Priestia flexa TaxID=86664 RepID=UPI0024C0E268|nr:hypothetical protein [Priestia flexa]WHX80007.1 hypothetical protein QNH32_05200 [Priestia flexa]